MTTILALERRMYRLIRDLRTFGNHISLHDLAKRQYVADELIPQARAIHEDLKAIRKGQ